MPRQTLNTEYIYSIRNTPEMRVYRSSRNPKFVVKVCTLSEMAR